MVGSLEELAPGRDQEAQKKRVLQQSRALRSATRATRDGIAQIGRLCSAARRTKLTVMGEGGSCVYVIASGRVRVERALPSGRTMHVAHLGRGDLVGDLTLDQGRACDTAIVVEDATVLALPVLDVLELAARDSGVYQVLGAALVERSRMLEDRLESLLLHKVEARLAAFLLYSMDRWGSSGPDGVVLGTSLRHHEIANMIGTGREWVTMTLTKLRRRKILGAVGRRVLVRSVDQLRALAAGQRSL